MNNRHAQFAILDVVDVVCRAREGVHGHRHRANLCGTKERCYELFRIRQQDQDAVAARYALREQRVPHAIRQRCQFTVGYFARFPGNGYAIRMPLRRLI